MDLDDYGSYNYVSSDDDDGICVSHNYSSNESSSDEDTTDLELLLERTSKNSAGQHSQPMLDPFEEEMSSELDRAMNQLKGINSSKAAESAAQRAASGSRPPQPRGQYDSIYFDSDEDEEDQGVRQHRKTVSDSELLYDPTLDEQDQQWMDRHRGPAAPGCAGSKKGSSKGEQQQKGSKKHQSSAAETDAVLNCPGCLTMLCADCQRHSSYSSQYRAMFVFSCRVDRTQLLRCPHKLTKKEIWKNKKKERQMKRRKYMEDNNEQMEHYPGNESSADVQMTVSSNVQSKPNEFPEGNSEEKDHCSLNESTTNTEKMLSSNALSTSTEEFTEGMQQSCVEQHSTKPLSDSQPGDTADHDSRNGCHVNDNLQQNDEIILKNVKTDTDNNPPEEGPSNTLVLDDNYTVLKRNIDEMQTINSPVKKVRFLEPEHEQTTQADVAGNVSAAVNCAGDDINGAGEGEEMFHPVMCQHCNTKVAVMDKDEVYHFFNVITSY